MLSVGFYEFRRYAVRDPFGSLNDEVLQFIVGNDLSDLDAHLLPERALDIGP